MASLKKINKIRRGRRDAKILEKRHKKARKYDLKVQERVALIDKFLEYSEKQAAAG